METTPKLSPFIYGWMEKLYVCVCVCVFVCVYIYDGILFSHKNEEIFPFVITFMDLESTMLREITQRKTNTIWSHLYVAFKNLNQKTKQQQTHSKRDQICGYQRQGVRWRGVEMEEGGWNVQIFTYKLNQYQECKTIYYSEHCQMIHRRRWMFAEPILVIISQYL